MKRNDSNHQCLSLKEIKSFLNNEVSEKEKSDFIVHFSTCELCDEVKESFSTVNQLGVEEDIAGLRDEVFDTINHRSIQTRRLFLSKIAAGVLLPITGVATLFYWNVTSNDRLFKNNFQSYLLADGGPTRGGGIEDYDNVTLPNEFKSALEQYKSGNYKESLSSFKAYRKIQPKNTYANFLHGLAQLETGNIELAIYFLEEVRMNDTNLYEDATWYLALVNIKKKNKTAAKQYLGELIDNNSQFYVEKAKTLIKEL